MSINTEYYNQKTEPRFPTILARLIVMLISHKYMVSDRVQDF